MWRIDTLKRYPVSRTLAPLGGPLPPREVHESSRPREQWRCTKRRTAVDTRRMPVRLPAMSRRRSRDGIRRSTSGRPTDRHQRSRVELIALPTDLRLFIRINASYRSHLRQERRTHIRGCIALSLRTAAPSRSYAHTDDQLKLIRHSTSTVRLTTRSVYTKSRFRKYRFADESARPVPLPLHASSSERLCNGTIAAATYSCFAAARAPAADIDMYRQLQRRAGSVTGVIRGGSTQTCSI